jgi:hypothetical protein
MSKIIRNYHKERVLFKPFALAFEFKGPNVPAIHYF